MISVEVRPGEFSSYHLAERGKVVPGDWSREAQGQLRYVLAPVALNREVDARHEKYQLLDVAATDHLLAKLRMAAKEVRGASKGKIGVEVGEPGKYALFVIPKEKKYLVTSIKDRFGATHGDNCEGIFLSEYKLAVVYSRGDFLDDAYVLAHERGHALARLLLITSKSHPKMSMWRTGHEYLMKYAYRGRLLEEASAVAAGMSFLGSERFTKAFPGEVNRMMINPTYGTRYPDVNTAVAAMMERRYTADGEYWLFYKVRQKMIAGASLVEPQFENLLMLARVHPPLERLVRDSCDKVFGRGTYRWIMRTNHAGTEDGMLTVRKMLNWLELPDELVKKRKFERKKKRESREDLAGILERFSFPVDRQTLEKVTMVWDRMLLTDKYMGELEANKIVLSSGLAYLEMRGDVVGLTKYLYNRVSSRKF